MENLNVLKLGVELVDVKEVKQPNIFLFGIGYTADDEPVVCEFCGKKELNRYYIINNSIANETLYIGSTCVHTYLKKYGTNLSIIEEQSNYYKSFGNSKENYQKFYSINKEIMNYLINNKDNNAFCKSLYLQILQKGILSESQLTSIKIMMFERLQLKENEILKNITLRYIKGNIYCNEISRYVTTKTAYLTCLTEDNKIVVIKKTINDSLSKDFSELLWDNNGDFKENFNPIPFVLLSGKWNGKQLGYCKIKLI